MKLLFIGDICGKTGRQMVKEHLPQLRARYAVDIVMANAENAAHGKGITQRIYEELRTYGVDYMTLGNHAFSKSEVKLVFHRLDRMIRPYNLLSAIIGKGYLLFSFQGIRICLVNLLGQSFMDVCGESPFACMEEILQEAKADVYLVDLHAETTAEKMTFAYCFQKEVQLVVGTHTHVQTADERLIGQCAYISDVGMCGAYDSILGRDVQEVLARAIDGEKTRFTVAEGPGCFHAVLVDIDEQSLQATRIERIQIRPSCDTIK